MVLWAFVFAWHSKYTGRPVFTTRIQPTPFIVATLTGIVAAAVLYTLVDPQLSKRTPQDYPADLFEWLAMLLFSLAFTQLFLIFAPFAWLIRLSKGKPIAIPLTVLFGVFVLVVKNHGAATPIPPLLYSVLVIVRVVVGSLSVYLFLKGGVPLVWWWGFLVQSRHLLKLVD